MLVKFLSKFPGCRRGLYGRQRPGISVVRGEEISVFFSVFQFSFFIPVEGIATSIRYIPCMCVESCCIPCFDRCIQRFIPADRKSTRLNSSHVAISYAVFCL